MSDSVSKFFEAGGYVTNHTNEPKQEKKEIGAQDLTNILIFMEMCLEDGIREMNVKFDENGITAITPVE